MSAAEIIAVVGAGGKTSWIYEKAKSLAGEGKTVLITTSTHMALDSTFPSVLIQEDGLTFDCIQTIRSILSAQRIALVAGYDLSCGKLIGISSETCPYHETAPWANLKILSALCDVLLIEADGSRQLPVKAPGNMEPQIPPLADKVVGVIGEICLDKPISDCAFRPELLAERLGCSVDTRLTEEHIQQIAVREDLLRKGVNLRSFELYRRAFDPNLSGPSLKLVLLAAGNSTRFGDNKLFANVDGQTLFQRSLNRLLHVRKNLLRSSAWRSIVIVVVTQYEAIIRDCLDLRISVVQNSHPEHGISSSLILGLQAAGPSDAVMFGTCDQPWLSEDTLENFLKNYLSVSETIGCLSYQGIPGNPCIFDRRYFQELMALTGDSGGKRIVKAHPKDVWLYEVTDPQELTDIDFKEDLQTPLNFHSQKKL